MSKRTGFLIVALVILLIIGVLVFLFLFAPESLPFGSGSSGGGTRPGGFFPFGGGEDNTVRGGEGGTTTSPLPIVGGGPLPILRDISSFPVSGATIIDDLENEISRIRYVEREKGHVYETTTTSANKKRVSNVTVPKTQRVLWADDGNSLVFQYQNDTDQGDTVVSYYGLLSETQQQGVEPALGGIFLPIDIVAMAPSPEKTDIFYIAKNLDGVVGIRANIDDTDQNVLFESPLTEWRAQWPKEDSVVLSTKASGVVTGYSYILGTKTKKLSSLLGGKPGLVVLPNHDLTKILYSTYEKERGLSLKVRDRAGGSENAIFLTTVAEKCVWGKADPVKIYCGVPNAMFPGIYPDDWYQGVVSFSDSVWSIDSETGAADLIADLEKISDKQLDMTNLFLSAQDEYLFFTDKNELHLWSIKIGVQ